MNKNMRVFRDCVLGKESFPKIHCEQHPNVRALALILEDRRRQTKSVHNAINNLADHTRELL